MPILNENALHITRCRLGFPALVKPKASVPNADPKYSAVLIMEPDAPEWAEFQQLVQALATSTWGEDAPNVLNAIKADKRLRCYGNGNEKISTKTSKVYDGFEDKVFVSGSNNDQPKLVGANAQPLPPTANANQMFTGGNYVSAVITLWAQNNSFGKAIRANLDAVQYLEEGEHFGSAGVNTDGVFAPVEGAPPATGGPAGNDFI